MTRDIYELLIHIKDRIHDFDDKRPAEIYKLQNLGYLEHYHYDKNGRNILAWKLTELAKKDMEEYEKSLRQEDREIKSLQIAEEANRSAKKANKISAWAIFISAILSILTIVASFLIAIFVKG